MMVAISTMKSFGLKLLIGINLSLLLFLAILGLHRNGEIGRQKAEVSNYDKNLQVNSETTNRNNTHFNGPNGKQYKSVLSRDDSPGNKKVNMSARVTEIAHILQERLEDPTDRQPRKVKFPCENIDYSKNTYEQRKPCYGAKCDEKFNRSFEDRVRDVLRSPQYQLSTSQLETILSLGQNVPKTDIIIVSAVSSNHYDEVQMMFKNLHETVYPTLGNFHMVLFDIGLSSEERTQTEKRCRCQLVTFNFDLFPKHVSDRHCYSWKPFIIRALIERARKLVVWQDASVRWRSRYFEMLDRANKLGLQVFLGGGDRVTANTLHETFQYMEEPECLFESVPEVANAVAVYRADDFNKLALLTPWARCALEPSCICPQNPQDVRYCGELKPLRCHRFDQSALTLLLGKLFYDERYRFEIQQPYHTEILELQRSTVAPKYFKETSSKSR